MFWILLVIILGGADTALTLHDELPETNPSTEYLHFWNSDDDALRNGSTLEENFGKLFENSNKELTTVEPDEELNLKVNSDLIDNSTLEDEKRSVVVVVVTNNFNGGRNEESEEPNKIVVPHVSLDGFHKSSKHNRSHFGGKPHLLGSQRPLLFEDSNAAEDLTTEAPTKSTLQKITSYISNAFSGFGNGKKSEEVNNKDADLKLSSDAFKKEVPTETVPSKQQEHINLGHDFGETTHAVQSVHNINIIIEEPSGAGDNVKAEDPTQYSIKSASSPQQKQPIATVPDLESFKTKGLEENFKGINASAIEDSIESAENFRIQKDVAEVEIKNQLSRVIATENEELHSTSLLVNTISKTGFNYEQPTTNGLQKSITAKSGDILHDFIEEVLTNATRSSLDAEGQTKQYTDNDPQEPEVHFKLEEIAAIESDELLKTNNETARTENLHNSTFENTNFTQQPYEQRVFTSNGNLQNDEIESNSPVQNTRSQFDENQNASSQSEDLINESEKVLQIDDSIVKTESNGYEGLLKIDEQNVAPINSAIEQIPIFETEEIEATKQIFQNKEIEVATGKSASSLENNTSLEITNEPLTKLSQQFTEETTEEIEVEPGKSAASSFENNKTLVIEIRNGPLTKLSQQFTEEITETSHNVVENKEHLLRANEKQVSDGNSIVDLKLVSNIQAASEITDKNEIKSSSENEELIEEIFVSSSFSDKETSRLIPLVSEETTDTQISQKFLLDSAKSVIRGADEDIVNSNIAPVFNINADILEQGETKVLNEDSKLKEKIEAVKGIDELAGVDQQNIFLEKIEPKVFVNEELKLEENGEAVEVIDKLEEVDQQNIILEKVEPKVVGNEDSKLEENTEAVEGIDELRVDQQNIILEKKETKVVGNEDSKLEELKLKENIEAVEGIDELVGVDQENIILEKVETKVVVNEDTKLEQSKIEENTKAVESIDELIGVDQQNIILEKIETKVAGNEDSKLEESKLEENTKAVEGFDELVGVDQQDIILEKVETKVVVNEDSKLEESKLEENTKAVEGIDELVGVDQQNIILKKLETKVVGNEDSKLEENTKAVEGIDELGVDQQNIVLEKLEPKVVGNEDSKLEESILEENTKALEGIDELVQVDQQDIILEKVETKVVGNEDSKLEENIEAAEGIDELGVYQPNIILKKLEPKVVGNEDSKLEESKLEENIKAEEGIDELVGVNQQDIILEKVETKVVINEDSKLEESNLEENTKAVEGIDELVGVGQQNIIKAFEVVEDLEASKARHTGQIEVAVPSDANKQLILQEISNKGSAEIDITSILKQEIQEIIAKSDDANSAKNDIIYDEVFEEPSSLDEGNPTQPRIQVGLENDQETIQQKKVSTESKKETISKTQFDYDPGNGSFSTASEEDVIEKLGLPDEIEELLRKEIEEYSQPKNAGSKVEQFSDLSSTQENSSPEYTAKEILRTSVDIPEDVTQTAITEVAMGPVLKNDFSEQIIFEDNPEQTAINTLKEFDNDNTGIELGIGGLESQLEESSKQNQLGDTFGNDTSIEARKEDLVPDLLQPIECVNCGIGGLESQLQESSKQNQLGDAFGKDTNIEARNEDLVPDLLQPIECTNCDEAEINVVRSKNILDDRQEGEVQVYEQVSSIQTTQLSEDFNNLEKKEEVVYDNNNPIGKAHLINIEETLRNEKNELSEKSNPEAAITVEDSRKTLENREDHELIVFPNVDVNNNAALINEKETQLIQNIKFIITEATNDAVANNVNEDVVDIHGNEDNVKLDILSPDATTVKVNQDHQNVSNQKKEPERQSFADSKPFSSDSVDKKISEVATKLTTEGFLVDGNISHLPAVRENIHETVRNEQVLFPGETRSQIEETDRSIEDVETILAHPDEFITSSKNIPNGDGNHSSSKLQENVINVEQKNTEETSKGSEELILAIQEETKLFSIEDSSESQAISQNESNNEDDSSEDQSDDNIRNIPVESITEITKNSELNLTEESIQNHNERSSEEDSGEDLSEESITASYWSLINQQLKLATEANPSAELPRHGKKVIGAEQLGLDLPISVFQGRSMPFEDLYNTPSLFLNPNFIPTKVEFSPAEEISSELEDSDETGRSISEETNVTELEDSDETGRRISEETTVLQLSEENLSSTQSIAKESFDAKAPGKDDASTISTNKSNEDNEDRPKNNISTSYWDLMNEQIKIATEADPTLRQQGSDIEEGQRKLAIIRQPVFGGRSMSSEEIVDPELLPSNPSSTQSKSELSPEEVLPGADNPHIVIKKPASEVATTTTPTEVTTAPLFDEDQPVVVQPESDSTNQFIEAIVEAAELTTELSRFVNTFHTPMASDDTILVPVTEASRTTDNLELVESKLVANAPDEPSPASYQHAAVNLAVILITSLVILLLILSLLVLIFVKFRNQQGTLDIQMEEQRSDLEMNTSQS